MRSALGSKLPVTAALLKWNGQRRRNRCTVVVTYQPLNSVWQRDTDDLAWALCAALAEFEALLPSPLRGQAE